MFKNAGASVVLALLTAGTVIAQDSTVPSTVSDEAAEMIRTMKPIEMAPANKTEWQLMWAAAEETGKSVVEETTKRYPAKIEKNRIAGADHLLLTPSTLSSANENRIVVY